MKSTNPVAGQPTPAIDACLPEATAGLVAGRAAVGRRGPDRLVAASAASLAAGPRPPVSGPRPVPGPAWPSVRGWATAAQPKASATKPSTSTSAAGATSTKSTTATSTGEWAFLDDKHVSIEDKLFKFMTLVQKKNDKELEDKIKDFKANYTKAGSGTSSSSTTKSSGGGLLGFVKQALGAIKLPFGLSLDKLVDQLVGQVGPKLLAMAAIPLGSPALAPAIEKAASAILPALFDTGASSSSSTTSSSKEAGSPDEKIAMLEIQRLVEKQNQMFTCISNVMKSMHDTGMSAINNIR